MARSRKSLSQSSISAHSSAGSLGSEDLTIENPSLVGVRKCSTCGRFEEPWYGFFIAYPNMKKTISTLLAWFSFILMHHSCTLGILEFAAEVDPLSLSRPPLKDVLHEYLPNLQRFRMIPEFGDTIIPLYVGLKMLWYFDQRSLDAIRTFLWVHGALMVMRGACFSSTLVPDASQQCIDSKYPGSCHDLIFSGHVVLIVLSLQIGWLFFPETPRFHNLILFFVSVVTIFLIAASRNHYTVDILLALLLTPLTLHFWVTYPPALALSVLHPTKYPWTYHPWSHTPQSPSPASHNLVCTAAPPWVSHNKCSNN